VFVERFGDGLVAKRYSKTPMAPPSDVPEPDDPVPAPRTRTGGGDQSSHYEAHRDRIIAALRVCNGNLSATERLLKSQGIRCTRRWIAIFATKWGIR
jgi:hypothetical protein